MTREFKTLGGFARHLERLAVYGNEVTEAIAEKSAEHIRDAAREKLGVYQPATGPFPQWVSLSQETMAERMRYGFTPNEPLLRSGQLRDAIASSVVPGGAQIGVPHGPHYEPDGTVKDVGEIAIDMEFGSVAPPRPFLGPAAYESKLGTSKLAARMLVAWLAGENWLRPPQSIKLP